ncbi:MAG: phosphoglycerate dehydrogenase [Proteobacteria bacterium]|jgi:D-3-phosphoglycerate dehydrogenase / 2-oxoglutarate reductase|nr:phosphoglycerate dehydrogenase [Pseudomonadota bacterium]NCV23665.1 phosphoglycerate dehydrogenase [Pseudomonadota bacterium]
MFKVLIADKLSEEAVRIFSDNGIEAIVKNGLDENALIEALQDCDGLVVRSATKATKKVIESCKKLKVIGRAGIGVDNVDLEAATNNGKVVMNTPFGNSITTAEHAITLILSTARQIPYASQTTHEGKWEKSSIKGIEVTGKYLGVIGCGNIGSIVAQRALGLHFKVLAFDPFLQDEKAKEMGVEKVTLDELFKRSDFITLHTPLTEKTKNIIGKDSFAKMKKGVRIINCARGGLVDEDALKENLESGHVASAALDVFVNEPPKGSSLLGTKNLILTPHLGASTTEAQEKVALQIAEQISDYLKTGAILNAVNTFSLTAKEYTSVKPYLKLCSLLGGFAGQLTENAVKSVQVEFEGQAANINTQPLLQTIVFSLLKPTMDNVNVINSLLVAKSKSIAISEVKHQKQSEYQTLIKLIVTTDKQTRSVSGTLFGGKPRVVEVKGIEIDAELSNHNLYISNEDKPGFIRDLSKVLADNNINIATFHLGRKASGQEAIALISTDSAIDNTIVENIKKIPLVIQAKYLQFDDQ